MAKAYIKDVVVIENPSSKDLTKTYHSVKMGLPKYWDRDYINSKINQIENYTHKMLCNFLWMSAVRVTESINVKKKDIDFKNGTMTVNWQKNRKYQYRVVPVHPLLLSLLEIFTAKLKQEDKIFPITRQRVYQLTKKHIGGGPHKLRHSFAVNWLRCGGDIIILHKILGHSNIKATMHYLDIVPIDQGKELIKIQFR